MDLMAWLATKSWPVAGAQPAAAWAQRSAHSMGRTRVQQS